jgi:hypothetical protein
LAHRSIGFIHAANWLFAAILGFLFVVQWDEIISLPVTAGVSVFEDDASQSSEALRPVIAEFAREHEITFAQEERDFENWHGGRILYLVDGDPSLPGADWLAGDYADFSQSVDTEVRPYADLEGPAAGSYAVFGDPAKARELADFLTAQGLRTEVFDVTPWGSVLAQTGRSMLTALTMMFLVSVAMVGAGVLLGTRAYGVGRLQGLSFGNLLGGDLRRVAKVWAVAGAATLAAATAALAVYNGLVGIGAYLGVVLAIDLVLTAAAVAAHALVLALTMQVRILASVKGELPGKTAVGVAYALRLTTVVVALALVAQVLALGTDLARRDRLFGDYAAQGDTSTVTLGGLSSIEEEADLVRVVGSWLRDEDRAGHVILAGESVLPSMDPALAGQPVLYVNERFLREQPPRSADGTAYVPDAAAATPTVLVPSGLWERRGAVVEALAADVVLADPSALTAAAPLETAGGQAIFTYNTTGGAGQPRGELLQDETYASDPVIVVLPSAAGLLDEGGYVNFASNHSVLFPDPDRVADARAQDPELARFVVSTTPVATNAAVENQELTREFRLNLFSALAAALVLVITGIGAVLVYTRQNAQWIFARHVTGWRYGAVHRLLLAFELCVLAVLVGWLPYQVWSQTRQIHQMYGDPPPFAPPTLGAAEWTSIALLALVAVGGVLTALAFTHRRVIRAGASEA